MSAGIGLAKKEKKNGFVEYKRSSRILKMRIAKNRNAKRKNIAGKLAKKIHVSNYKAYKDFDNYIKFLKDEKVASELELDDEAVDVSPQVPLVFSHSPFLIFTQ